MYSTHIADWANHKVWGQAYFRNGGGCGEGDLVVERVRDGDVVRDSLPHWSAELDHVLYARRGGLEGHVVEHVLSRLLNLEGHLKTL